MASNYPPLTPLERQQLRDHPNVDLIVAWTLVKRIVGHPEVTEQIRIKEKQVRKTFIIIIKNTLVSLVTYTYKQRNPL